MARFDAFILLALMCTVAVAVRDMPEKKSCAWVSALPGGCPDLIKCSETCKPCFKGVGDVVATCNSPSIWVTEWECRCTFVEGASCPPPDAPSCPGNPFYPPIIASTNSTV